MLSGIQIILARAILGISQEELAKKLSNISLSTIGRLEKEKYEVYKKGRLENFLILEKFFKNKGIRFIEENGEIGIVINKKLGKKLDKKKL